MHRRQFLERGNPVVDLFRSVYENRSDEANQVEQRVVASPVRRSASGPFKAVTVHPVLDGVDVEPRHLLRAEVMDGRDYVAEIVALVARSAIRHA